MFERGLTFSEYVSYYGLARSEGLVLRYIADAYRALRQTVPDEDKTPELEDLIEWLAELVRQVDSSLLDEWERLQNPTGESEPQPALTRNVRALRVQVRNALFRRVQLMSLRRADALAQLDPEVDWESTLDDYYAQHDHLNADAQARGPAFFVLEEGPAQWRVRQILADPAGDHDWSIAAVVDLAACDEAGEAVVTVTKVGQAQAIGNDW